MPNTEEKRYKCGQYSKTFKKKYYHLKHLRLTHSYFECEKCHQKVKEGSRALHMLRCSEDKKTVCCNICGDNLEFELILEDRT